MKIIMLLFAFFWTPNQQSVSAIEECTVSPIIVYFNGECSGKVHCGRDTFWIACCSDFGQDVGWCRGNPDQ